MERSVGLHLVLLLTALVMFPQICTGMINYMLTVEQPVTLVTNSQVVRQNGSCCGPLNCTTCPDDPSVDFVLFVCFRRGNVEGFLTDTAHCPLGGMEFTPPNSELGETVTFEPRPEAVNISAEYPGSVQLLVRITTRVNNVDTPLDDVLVPGRDIPADGTFRRIIALSTQETAIVGVNVKVECVNETTTPDCSVPVPTTGGEDTMQTTTEGRETSTEPSTPTTGDEADTTTETNMPSEGAQTDSISAVSLVIGLCIGLVVAAVLTAALCCTILCYTQRKHRIAAMKAISKETAGMTLSSNPTIAGDQLQEGVELYQESPDLPTTFL